MDSGLRIQNLPQCNNLHFPKYKIGEKVIVWYDEGKTLNYLNFNQERSNRDHWYDAKILEITYFGILIKYEDTCTETISFLDAIWRIFKKTKKEIEMLNLYDFNTYKINIGYLSEILTIKDLKDELKKKVGEEKGIFIYDLQNNSYNFDDYLLDIDTIYCFNTE